MDSVSRTRYPNFEIVLVDNASNDASIAAIERKGKAKRDVTIVKNNHNMGFAEGNNVGARHSAGDLLVFINNDTEVPADWLDDLVHDQTEGLGPDRWVRSEVFLLRRRHRSFLAGKTRGLQDNRK
jgi:glycosyltransferase involved in cell wall biosynthesis